MLSNGELIGELETTWDELLDHGDEPFDLSFSPVRGICPSLTLKAAVVHSCDNQDSPQLDVCDIDRTVLSFCRNANCSPLWTARLLETQMQATPYLLNM